MFQKTELERLQAQKALLVLQTDVNRLLLAAEWQRVSSPDNWLHEAGNLARRHPLWTAALAAGAGSLAAKAVRRPGAVAGGIGRLALLTLAGWRLLKSQKKEF